MVSWFTSSEEEQGEEMQFLILVYPQIAGRKVEMSSIPSAETAALEENVSRSVVEKNRKVRAREELSWFEKMFIW